MPVYCSICCMLLPQSEVFRTLDLLSNKYQVISGKLYKWELISFPAHPSPFISERDTWTIISALTQSENHSYNTNSSIRKKNKCLKMLPMNKKHGKLIKWGWRKTVLHNMWTTGQEQRHKPTNLVLSPVATIELPEDEMQLTWLVKF